MKVDGRKNPAGEPLWRTDAEFVAFIRAYPRRCAPMVAFQAWQKSRAARPAFDVLMNAIARQIEWRRQLELSRQFVPAWPYPATWLNQQRWEDELDSLAGTPELKAPAPTPEQQHERRMAELAMDCWMQIRNAVMTKRSRPLMGWGHAAADQVLSTMGGLDALERHINHLPRAQATFLSRMAEAMRSRANASESVTALRQRA